jgi:hypothetical protein
MYVFKYKRKNRLFSKKIKVVGHKYLPDQNKMVLFKEDGGLEEVLDWKNCAVTLGVDWVAATKKKMEQEAGTSIPLNIG